MNPHRAQRGDGAEVGDVQAERCGIKRGSRKTRQGLRRAGVVPDRRWFGNTRVIGQKQLEEFREEMATKSRDGYTVLIKQKKLRLSLLKDEERAPNAREFD